MRITRQIRILLAVFATLAIANILFLVLSSRATHDMTYAHELRHTFSSAWHSFRVSSAELTRLTRSYVINELEPDLEQYWQELLSYDFIESVRHELLRIDPSPEVLNLFSRAIHYHEELKRLETLAVEASTAGDQNAALDILFGLEYSAYETHFIAVVSLLSDITYSRTEEMLNEASTYVYIFDSLAVFFTGILAIVVVAGTYSILRNAAKVAKNAQNANKLNEIFLGASPMIINIWDEDHKLVQTSEQATKMFGLKNKKEYMERFIELSPEFQPCGAPTSEKVEGFLNGAFKEGRAQFEWMHQDLEGNPIPTEVTLVRFTYEGKNMLVAYTTDLRPVKNAMARENALKRELELTDRIKTMFDSAPMAVNLYDCEFNLLDCNEEALRMFGFEDKNDFIERFSGRMVEFSAPIQPCGLSAAHMMKDLRAKAVASKTRTKFEWVYVNKDGAEIPAEVTVANIPMGETFVMVMYIHDLSDIRTALDKEKELFTLNQLYLDACPMFIEKWDADFNLIDCNETAVELFEVESKYEFIARYDEFMPEFQPCGTSSAEYIAVYSKKALEEGFARYELMHQTARGEEVPVEVTNVRIKRGGEFIIIGYNFDLRDIKAAERKQRQASLLNQMILDSAPFIIAIWDHNRNLISISQHAAEFFGVSETEILSMRIFDYSPVVQPDGESSAEKISMYFEKTYDEGQSHFEWTHQTASGEIVPSEITAKRFNYNGEDVVVSYTADLRAIHAAMEKERETHELTQMIFNSAPIAIGLWDESGIPVQVSYHTKELFGAETAEGLNEKLEEYAHVLQPCGTPSMVMAMDNIKIAFEEGSSRFEWIYQDEDGAPLPMDIILKSFRHREKDRVISFASDLRKIKAAIEQSFEAESRALLLLDATPLSCFMARYYEDEDGIMRFRAIDCNQATLDLFGFKTKEEAIKGFVGTFPKSKEVKEFVFRKVAEAFDKGYNRFEFEQLHVSGEIIPCEITMVRIYYKGETVLAYYTQDLRELKRMIEELKRIDAAEEESRAKTRFLARMSHEIRTPMNAVMGITEIELQKDGHSPETIEAFLRIHNSSNMLLTIINDILDLSKAESGRMEIMPALYEVSSMVVDTVQLNLLHIGSKSIKFRLEIDENIPAYLIGDELRLKQILNNLLSNAFKYTRIGEVVLTFKAESRGDEEVYLSMSVEDTGQGMTQEQVENLFAADFTRFNLENNRVIEGSGLGMMITHHLITMMNGEISVTSVPGEGSIFTVCVPQKTCGSNPLGKEAVENLQKLEETQLSLKKVKKTRREPMPYGRVLVVDDVESNLYVVKGILQPYKIAVETVTSGFDAVDKISDGEEYDIIFMDHMMPKMDGIETTKRIRDMGYKKPIVALTANALKGVSSMFLENGFDGFISKPIDIDLLNAFLVRHIREQRSPEEIAAARAQNISNIDGLTEAFLLDAKRAVEILEPLLDFKAPEDEELKAITTQFHAMRSALNNIGRIDLSKLAGALETAAREFDMQTIEMNSQIFIGELKELIEELAAPAIEESDEFQIEEDIEYLWTTLAQIAEACEDYEVAEAKRLLDELTAKTYSRDTKELLKEISANILYGDFDGAAELARKGNYLWKNKKPSS
ncbi:MAG: PAS domain S-box protein [Clostridiales bacterium]|nr:PAS domain S-box protein [Clostridiales bacterium]